MAPFVPLLLALISVLWAGGVGFGLDRDVPKLPNPEFDYTSDGPIDAELKAYDTLDAGNRLTNAGATLGRVLFFDSALSKNRLVRCASCHSQRDGFDDPNRFSIGFEGKITPRHSMGLANARFNWNDRYFWDERVATLEKQVLDPIYDPVEMGLNPDLLVERVASKSYYPPLFAAAFGESAITERHIASALAQFVRAMVAIDARFDQAREGAGSMLEPFEEFSALENRGKFLFFAPLPRGAGCAQCHETALFLMKQPANNGLQGGDGAAGQVFRAASLRNIAIRAPYMHDGRFDTLKQVMDHYGGGIQAARNLDPRLVDANGKGKVLVRSEADKLALIAFLSTPDGPAPD